MQLISVIMPAYNAQEYIEESISSILNQTYKEFEFIIIDDGSTDETRSIIEKFKVRDNRIKPVYQNRMGLTVSLNKAISLSCGKYIARQDADDISSENRIEKLLNFAESGNYDIVGSYAKLINEKGNKIGVIKTPVDVEEIRLKLEWNNCIAHPGIMLNRESILKIGSYNKEFKYSQDYELYLRAINNNLSIGIIPEELVSLRFHENSLSLKNRRVQIMYAISAQAKYFAKRNESNIKSSIRLINHIIKILIPLRVRKIRLWMRNNK